MGRKKGIISVESVAKELGLSKSTVSRALSGKGRISQGTRERVAAFVKQAGYEMSGSAGRMERIPTHNLALVIPPHFVQLDLPFLRKSMGGVCRMAALRGYDVLLCYADERSTEHLERQLAANKVDGVILSRTLRRDPCLTLVQRYGLPYAALGRLENPDALQVDNDHAGASRELTHLLLQMGIRRIVYLGNRDEYLVNIDRMNGFRQALIEYGIKPDPNMIFSGLNTDEKRLDALEAALEQKPECILCGDDDLALRLLQDLRQRGISVPEQIRLASLYDSDILLQTVPTVTAVQFDAASLGASACRLLLDAMAGKEVSSRQIYSYQVIFRESTK